MAVTGSGLLQNPNAMRELKFRLQSLNASLSTPGLYATMNSIHQYFQQKSQDMFDTESGPNGDPWEPLKRTTIEMRRSLGFGARPINVRTAKMKNYFVRSRIDIIGHSDGVISYAFPQRAWPDKEMRIRLNQAAGLYRGGPARPVVGMNGVDVAFVLGTMRKNLVTEILR